MASSFEYDASAGVLRAAAPAAAAAALPEAVAGPAGGLEAGEAPGVRVGNLRAPCWAVLDAELPIVGSKLGRCVMVCSAKQYRGQRVLQVG